MYVTLQNSECCYIKKLHNENISEPYKIKKSNNQELIFSLFLSKQLKFNNMKLFYYLCKCAIDINI